MIFNIGDDLSRGRFNEWTGPLPIWLLRFETQAANAGHIGLGLLGYKRKRRVCIQD